jgi:hypothetical protein
MLAVVLLWLKDIGQSMLHMPPFWHIRVFSCTSAILCVHFWLYKFLSYTAIFSNVTSASDKGGLYVIEVMGFIMV